MISLLTVHNHLVLYNYFIILCMTANKILPATSHPIKCYWISSYNLCAIIIVHGSVANEHTPCWTISMFINEVLCISFISRILENNRIHYVSSLTFSGLSSLVLLWVWYQSAAIFILKNFSNGNVLISFYSLYFKCMEVWCVSLL